MLRGLTHSASCLLQRVGAGSPLQGLARGAPLVAMAHTGEHPDRIALIRLQPSASHCVLQGVGADGARSFSKIRVDNPIVDLDGDEMTRCYSHQLALMLVHHHYGANFECMSFKT